LGERLMPNGCRAPWRDRGARLRRQIGWCDARGHCLGRDRTQTKVPSVAALTYGGTRNREPCHVVTDVSSGGCRDRSPQNFTAAVCLSCRQTSSKSDALARCRRERVQAEQLGIGAEPGHHEHRRPSTSVPTEASGRGGRRCADQSPSSSRSQGRRRPPKAFPLPARPGLLATTACPGQWPSVGSSDR
jgi:hypothetical protein